MALPTILHVASEAYPLAKSGGLGDVVGALPRAQLALGARPAVVLPAYPWIPRRVPVDTTGVVVHTPSGAERIAWEVLRTRLDGVPVFLLRCDRFFARPDLYGDGGRSYADNTLRFGLFARAVLEMLRELHWRPGILHLHDWHAALAAVYLRLHYAEDPHFFTTRTVLTVHNLAYQGLAPPTVLAELDLPDFLFHPEFLEFWGRVNPLKGGLLFADHLTTVSPTYAREIRTPAMGCGLEGVVAAQADRLTGILNGMDTEAWDPARDPYLPRPYTAATWRSGKEAARARLREVFGLRPAAALLAGFVGRLAEQKGVDLVLAALPALRERGVQAVLLGTGDPALEAACRRARREWPGAVGVHVGYEEGLAHLIQGGAEVLLMPSRYEPCGLNQLHALRYGTLPVVHPVGGLKDTVVPARPGEGAHRQATGFYLRELTPAGLVAAVADALRVRRDPAAWGAMVAAAMARDYSWRRSAAAYLALYHAAASRRDRPGPLAAPPVFPRPAARPAPAPPDGRDHLDFRGPYGEAVLGLLVQSPTSLFCYWELTPELQEALRRGGQLVLAERETGRRVAVPMNPPLLGDTWFRARPGRTYQAAWVSGTGRPFLLSPRVRTPRAGPTAGEPAARRAAGAALTLPSAAARLAARDRALLGLAPLPAPPGGGSASGRPR